MGRTRVKAHHKLTTNSNNNVNHILIVTAAQERKISWYWYSSSSFKKIPQKAWRNEGKKKRIGFDVGSTVRGGWLWSSILSDSHEGATAESISFPIFVKSLIAEKNQTSLPPCVECLNNNSLCRLYRHAANSTSFPITEKRDYVFWQTAPPLYRGYALHRAGHKMFQTCQAFTFFGRPISLFFVCKFPYLSHSMTKREILP